MSRRLVDKIYDIKEELTMQFKVPLATLLGQEWTSPSPLYMNIDSNDVIWISVQDPTYPDRGWCTKEAFLGAINELTRSGKIDKTDQEELLALIEKIPRRFEIPQTAFGGLEKE